MGRKGASLETLKGDGWATSGFVMEPRAAHRDRGTEEIGNLQVEGQEGLTGIGSGG
jgi:hypothetical protein